MGRMWNLLHYQSVSSRVSNSISSRGGTPPRLGAGASSAGWTWENRTRSSLWGGIGQAHEGGVSSMPPFICVAVPAGALDLSPLRETHWGGPSSEQCFLFPTDLNSAGWGHHNRWNKQSSVVDGAGLACSFGKRLAPVSTPHSWVLVCVSTYSFSRETANQGSLLDADKSPVCCSEAGQGGVTRI